MHYLTEALWFPPAETASKEGLLAIGGDLSAERLLLAYESGIFPWYEEDEPILWWSPDPRMVLFPKELKISKSLQKIIDKNIFKVSFNTAFKEVMEECAKINRKGQQGTWITSEMIEKYYILYEAGHARSVEVWKQGELVGGLYGVDLEQHKVFCGESMFSKESNASKVGFCALVLKLIEENYQLIDCQIHTAHLERLGAIEMPRREFLKYLNS